jgi:hypothetical protein
MPFAIKYEHRYAGKLYLAYDGVVGGRRRVRFDRDIAVAERFPTNANARSQMETLRDYLSDTTRDDARMPAIDPKLSVIAI